MTGRHGSSLFPSRPFTLNTNPSQIPFPPRFGYPLTPIAGFVSVIFTPRPIRSTRLVYLSFCVLSSLCWARSWHLHFSSMNATVFLVCTFPISLATHSSENSQIILRRPPFINIDRDLADVTYCHLSCFPIFHGLLQCDPPSDVHATPQPWCPQLRQTGNSTTLNASMAHTILVGTLRDTPRGTSSCRFDVLTLPQPVIVAITSTRSSLSAYALGLSRSIGHDA